MDTTLLETKWDCAMLALKFGLKRSAMDWLRQCLALANKHAPHTRPVIMRALNHARRLP